MCSGDGKKRCCGRMVVMVMPDYLPSEFWRHTHVRDRLHMRVEYFSFWRGSQTLAHSGRVMAGVKF